MTNFIEWVKDGYNTVYDFFERNFLAFLIIASAVIIVLFFIIARIATSGNYYAKLSKKFKRLDIIIRECQIRGDREKFLQDFNREVKKKNKDFSFAWNSFLLDEGQTAGMIFKGTKFDKDKKKFFNFFLVFSWIVPFCLLATLISFKKFDFASEESIYIVVLVPIFIIILGILFNSIYVSARNRQREDMLKHLAFFTKNVDGALEGFAKSDFELCGIKKEEPNINVSLYEGKNSSEQDGETLLKLVNTELTETKTQSALDLAKSIEDQNANVDLEQKLEDEESRIAIENEVEADESSEKILNNLKRLKNLEILVDQNHPFDDFDAERKAEDEKALAHIIANKKEDLDSTRVGQTFEKEVSSKKSATTKKMGSTKQIKSKNESNPVAKKSNTAAKKTVSSVTGKPAEVRKEKAVAVKKSASKPKGASEKKAGAVPKPKTTNKVEVKSKVNKKPVVNAKQVDVKKPEATKPVKKTPVQKSVAKNTAPKPAEKNTKMKTVNKTAAKTGTTKKATARKAVKTGVAKKTATKKK